MKQAWMTLDDFWRHCRNHPMGPLLRLLLSSDGSMVRMLNGLFLAPTGLEVIDQSERRLDDASAAQLEVPKGEKAMERSVWLTVERGPSGCTRVLFARSLFPISKIEPDFYQAIRLGEIPIGEIIEARGLETRRDKLEIACLPFPDIASALALAEDRLFWARRYRLTIPGVASALIREVFTPQLSSYSA